MEGDSFTAEQDMLYFTIPIKKMEKDADGNTIVTGIATNDDIDLDDQIIDNAFAKKGMAKWFSEYGNVRQMHSINIPPAGKAMEMEEKGTDFWVTSRIIEPVAQKLLDGMVYQAYSIGIQNPRIIRDNKARGGRVVDGIVAEISLVDFPANPACLPASVSVLIPQDIPVPLGVSRRNFTGNLLTVILGSGHQLTATPNHPVATLRGWVSLAELRMGDHVLHGRGSDGMSGVGPNIDNIPAQVEEVFQAYSMSKARRFTTMPRTENFHGDGAGDGDVEIVFSDGLVDDKIDLSLLEHLSKNAFLVGHPIASWAKTALARFGSVDNRRFGQGFSGDGAMRRSRQSSSLVETELRHPDAIRLTERANGSVALLEPTQNSGITDTQAIRDLLTRFPSQITADDVIDIQIQPFHGPVYNMETSEGWYMANGIVTHNCKLMMAKRAKGGDIEDIWQLFKRYEVYPDLEKRDMDPNVGGGVDRDKLKPGDFVFPKERVFPVMIPGDVMDAVNSWGQYKGGESFDSFKAKLTALCHRKGPSFVAQLPDKWTQEDKSFMTNANKAEEEHAAQTIPGLKEAAGKASEINGGLPDHPEPDGDEGGADVDSDGDGDKPRADEKAEKGKPFPGAAEPFDGSEKPGEGPSDGDDDEDKADKAGVPASPKPDDSSDGAAAEDEAGAGGADDEPMDNEDKTKSTVPYYVKRIHDALCPVFSSESVAKAYPEIAASGIKSVLTTKSVYDTLSAAVHADAGSGSNLDSIMAMAKVYGHATVLDKAPADVLAEIHAELHKGLMDANPDADIPAPTGQCKPGEFKRPLLTQGQAQATAHAGQSPKLPSSEGDAPPASDFDRGPLSTGQERQSPSNKGDDGRTPSGSSARTFYMNADKDQTRQAYQMFHDHMTGMFPDMCSMEAPNQGTNDDMVMNTAGSSSTSIGNEPPAAPTWKGEEADITKIVGGAADMVKADIVKAALVELSKKYDEQLATLTKSNEELAKRVEELESAPDPDQSAFRGSAVRPPVVKVAPEPEVDKDVEFAKSLLKVGDPAQRKMAAEALETKGVAV